MTFIDAVINDGRLALNVNQVEAFEAALHYSLTHDPNTPPDFSPFGFEQRQLYDLRVVLLRPLAFQYASEIDHTLTKSLFNKKTSIERYEQTYGRIPTLISVKPRIMCLTYTEWMGLALPEALPLTLPAELRR